MEKDLGNTVLYGKIPQHTFRYQSHFSGT